MKVQDYKKDKAFKLSGFDNFIFLFASNSKFKLFKEVSDRIKNISIYPKKEIGEDILKCFIFPFYPGLMDQNNKKKFLNENDENEK